MSMETPTTTPAQQPAITLPTAINVDIGSFAAPIIKQAQAAAANVATQVATDLHKETTVGLATLNTGLAGVLQDVAANKQQIEDLLARAGAGVITNVESDPVTQRALVLGVVGALLLGGLIVLVAYLTGNAQAAKVIGGVPAVAAIVLAWVSKAGVSLPGKKTT